MLAEYKKNNSDFSVIQSNTHRYILPGMGGILPGKRLAKREIEQNIELMKTIDCKSAKQMENAYEKTLHLLEVTDKNKRQSKYLLNKFIDWCKAEGFIENTYDEQVEKEIEIMQRKHPGKVIRRLDVFRIMTERGIPPRLESERVSQYNMRYTEEKIILSLNREDYINDYKAKFPDLNSKQIYHKIRFDLNILNQELEDIKFFLQEELHLADSTTKRRMTNIKTLLGGMYKQEKDLSQVKLKNLVYVVNIIPKIDTYSSYNKYMLAKFKAMERCKDIGLDLKKKLQVFFDSRSHPLNPSTRANYVECLINITKYNYRDIIPKLEVEEVPIITVLKKWRKEFHKELKVTSRAIPIEKKIVSWEQVMEVLIRAKYDAETDINVYGPKSKIQFKFRSKRAIGKSLMRFLLLGFFILLPPHRQQVYRELLIGKSFIYGYLDSGFLHSADSIDHEKYSYYLNIKDYKTKGSYGDFITKVPNFDFLDGSSFYDFIDRWIWEGYREEVMSDPSIENFFVGVINGKPITTDGLGSIIKSSFYRSTGVKVTSHTLRHIYKTHIESSLDLKLSDSERNSTAFAMKHSTEIANKIYNQQSQESKSAPAMELIQRINTNILRRQTTV